MRTANFVLVGLWVTCTIGQNGLMRFTSLRIFRSRRVLLALMVLFALSAGLAAVRLTRTEPILLGFLGTLSGPAGQTALDCADGALLAVEDCNDIGGIAGVPVRLELLDDRGNGEAAAGILDTFAARQGWAVIGPTNFSVADAAAKAAARQRLTLISPVLTVDSCRSATEPFASIRVSAAAAAEAIARHIRYKRNLLHTAVVVDGAAGEYAVGMDVALPQALATAGINIASVLQLPTSGSRDYPRLAQSLVGSGADNIVICAGGTETALLLQHLRTIGCDLPVIAYEPGSLKDLVAYAGSAAEGLTVIACTSPHLLTERYRAFVDRFRKRFGHEPDLAAAHGYDATRLALLSIADAQNPQDVRRALISRQWFDGLQGRISIGASASPKRELRVFRIQQGSAAPFD